MGSYVIAIDVGVKNLGICVFDFRKAKVVEWDVVNLVPNGRYLPSQNVTYVRAFVRKFALYFDDCFQVIVERQMRVNMRIIESVLQAMYYDTCIVVSPRAVKLHYDLSTNNYRTNKQKAVQWVEQFLMRNGRVFEADLGERRFSNASKKDDLADSLLLVLYYLDTYSNQLDNTIDFSLLDVEL